MKRLGLGLTIIVSLGGSLNANEFIEELVKKSSLLLQLKQMSSIYRPYLKEDAKKSITRILNSKPIVKKKHYKSGNIKEKIQIYNNLIQSKYSYKIITKYYDDENALIAKSGFYIEDEVVMEFIKSDNATLKCSLEYVALEKKVESVINEFVKGDLKSGYKFNEQYIQETIEKVGIEKTYDFLMVLPATIFAENVKKVRCRHDNSFTFKFKVEMGDSTKLISARGEKGSNVTSIEKANNIINKYYKIDLSLKDKMYNLKSGVVDFFNN